MISQCSQEAIVPMPRPQPVAPPQSDLRLELNGSMGHSIGIGKLLRGSCDKKAAIRLQLPIDTNIDRQQMVVIKPSNQPVQIEIAGESFPADPDRHRSLFPIAKDDINQLCQTWKQQDTADVSAAVVQRISDFIGHHLAGCPNPQLMASHVWQCRQEGVSIETLSKKIEQLHQRVLTQFKRHSYSFIRKVATTKQLAASLIVNNTESKLKDFCQLVSLTLEDELTLALRSPNWFKATCENPQGNPHQGAIFALQESYKELSRLYELSHQSSRRGVISLKFPMKDLPSKDLRLKLDLQEWTAKDNFKKISMATYCWHPLYSQTQKSQVVAQGLGLLSTKSAEHCYGLPMSSEQQKIVTSYVFTNIATESEFAIANGRGKLLRLPEGIYQYSIAEDQADFTKGPKPNKEISKGTLSWGSQIHTHILNKVTL